MSPSPRLSAPEVRARHANPSTARLWPLLAIPAAVLVLGFWPQVELVGTLVFIAFFVAALWVAASLGLG